MGFAIELFHDDVNLQDAQCAICQDIWRTPVTMTGCSHHFCSKCLETWLIDHEANLSSPRQIRTPGTRHLTDVQQITSEMSKLRIRLHRKNTHALLDGPPRDMRIQTNTMPQELRYLNPGYGHAPTRILVHLWMRPNPLELALFHVQGQIPKWHNPDTL